MNCRSTQKRLSAYMDGELAERESSRVRDHMAGCATCRKRLEQYQQLERAYVASSQPTVPADFYQRVSARITRKTPDRQSQPAGSRAIWDALFRPAYLKVPLELAAAAVVVVFVVTMIARTPAPTPVPTQPVAAQRVTPPAPPATAETEVAKTEIQKTINQVTLLEQNRVVIRSSHPEAAAVVTQALAASYQGRVLLSGFESSNGGKVLTLSVQLPQSRVAMFQKSLTDAQRFSNDELVAKVFHPEVIGGKAGLPAEELVPGPWGIVNKGIGFASATIASRTTGEGATDRQGATPGSDGRPKDQPSGLHGLVTIEVEIHLDPPVK